MVKKGKVAGGRPTLTGEVGGGESRRVSVRLTDTHITTAEMLGDGSLSEGVRMALELANTAVGTKEPNAKGGVIEEHVLRVLCRWRHGSGER